MHMRAQRFRPSDARHLGVLAPRKSAFGEQKINEAIGGGKAGEATV
jgi:hypothetical protein